MAKIEEIVVVGKRPIDAPDVFGAVSEAAGRSDGGLLRDVAFVAPAAVPKVIEEIIVTAPKPKPAARLASGIRAGLSRLGLAGAVGTVLGLTAREIIDELGEQMLEEAAEKALAPDVFPQRDSPVETIPEPQPIPEIVVTAPRLRGIRNLLLPPIPQFFPDFDRFDPYRMRTIPPRVMPTPAPQVETVEPIPAPTLPEVAPSTPAVVPLPMPSPMVSPLATPFEVPLAQPFPTVQPSPQVQPVPLPTPSPLPSPEVSPEVRPLTPVQPLVGTSTSLAPRLSAFPIAFPFRQKEAVDPQCPPCKDPKKERPEPRTECFKKLVKEGLFESMDSEYKWTEIDCLTGREL